MEQMHGTTILSVRRGNSVVIGGDGQVSLGNTIMKGNARKVRRLYHEQVIAGFAGGTADAFTLFERFEGKLEQHRGNLARAAVELAKDWRTDRMLRRLEALLAVADKETSLIISGNGDVIEPENSLMAIGSGGPYAQAAARALLDNTELRCARDRREIAADRRRHLRVHQHQFYYRGTRYSMSASCLAKAFNAKTQSSQRCIKKHLSKYLCVLCELCVFALRSNYRATAPCPK